MKEINQILSAYYNAQKLGLRTALATIVQVDGSSYRRPGARMLVCENGELTGAISGGCLEGDARRKALLAIKTGKNKLVSYDSADEEGEIFGIQLGCNGIVHILFEPIITDNHPNIITLLTSFSSIEASCLVTIFQQSGEHHLGTCALYQKSKALTLAKSLPSLNCYAQEVLQTQISDTKNYEIEDQTFNCLFNYIPPPVTITICGAGNDAIPMAQMAHNVGWHVTIADGRPTHATMKRFPMAHTLHIIKPGEKPPAAMAYILMSHNYHYDLAMLRQLLHVDYAYIGLLGPKKRQEKMLADLESQGITLTAEQRAKLFGPAGLNIGSETAEEIALSVIAEIKAVIAGATPCFLKDKTEPIHTRVAQ